MKRLALAALLATCLVCRPIRWAVDDGGAHPRPDPCAQAGAAVDDRSLSLLRGNGVQQQLGLSDEQKVEVARRLALTLDPEQEDLIRMILGQYHADCGRLRNIEDPAFDDDVEDARDERARLRALTGGFRDGASALIDRVLTPAQRAALGPRRCSRGPEGLIHDLTALRRDSMRRIAAALTPRERIQLRRLTLRAEGILAVLRPEVAARLQLSRSQRQRVRAIWDAAQADLDRLRRPCPVSPAYRDGDDLEVWMRPRLSTIREASVRVLADAGERVREVLLKK